MNGGAHNLGCGFLSWPRDERVSGRWGSITLRISESDDSEHVTWDHAPAGIWGTLVARVLGTRLAGYVHVGNAICGADPIIPGVGEEVTLGTGMLFTRMDYAPAIGLAPDDGRALDWLDPDAVRRCQEQFVCLSFCPGAGAS